MSRIRTIDLRSLSIPFTRTFRHASAERTETSTIWAEVGLESGTTGSGESCPREYVTGETIDTAQAFGQEFETDIRARLNDLESLHRWMQSHQAAIDRNPAAWCAVELAVLDALAKDAGVTLEQFLRLPELDGQFTYTAVLGDATPDVFHAAAREYQRFGFSVYKVKLSGDLERDCAKMSILRDLGVDPGMVRVDANNLWTSPDEAIAFLQALDYRFAAVEEPLRPSAYLELARLADVVGCRIILDESLLRIEQLALLPHPDGRWIANVRVSKMGGLLRSVALVERARSMGFGINVGAQVGETSLLTRAALPVARAAGDALIAQEGAFGTTLLTRDVCDPPLMFGPGGVLKTGKFPKLREPGLGVI